MIKCIFRFLDSEGKPTKYYGVAEGETKEQLFWEIDTFGDPYSTELRFLSPKSRISFCVGFKNPVEIEEDIEGIDSEDVETFETSNWVYFGDFAYDKELIVRGIDYFVDGEYYGRP
jgi:hypothetical protein